MAYSRPGETRRRIYAFVRERILSGSPPTIREVQDAFSFRSVQTARMHLEILTAEGLLEKRAHEARGYRLPDRDRAAPFHLVPVLGRIQAGNLTYAAEEPEGVLGVRSRFAREELFALRVRGDSMRDAGILPGDIVVVRRQASADPGDIVAALVGEEATVKRLRMKAGRIELHPENSAFRPIIPDPREVRILGKVVEVRRLFP